MNPRESVETNRKGRVAILISGRGSNMLSLVEAMRAGVIAADPVLVFSNRPDAVGLGRAKELGIPTESLDSRKVKPRRAHEAQVIETLQRFEVDLVCLAGYMRLLSRSFVEAFPKRIFNVHPSLLPAFPGLDAQQQALDYGVRHAGCTVHVVNEGCDAGPIILQAVVPVLPDDDEAALSKRIIVEEHRIYPEAVRLFFAGRLEIGERRVRILEPAESQGR